MTRNSYKLPKCWLGKTTQTIVLENGEIAFKDVVVTEDMVNPSCHCTNAMEAFWCMEGHMTECHAGMLCREANCSHMDRYE